MKLLGMQLKGQDEKRRGLDVDVPLAGVRQMKSWSKVDEVRAAGKMVKGCKLTKAMGGPESLGAVYAGEVYDQRWSKEDEVRAAGEMGAGCAPQPNKPAAIHAAARSQKRWSKEDEMRAAGEVFASCAGATVVQGSEGPAGITTLEDGMGSAGRKSQERWSTEDEMKAAGEVIARCTFPMTPRKPAAVYTAARTGSSITSMEARASASTAKPSPDASVASKDSGQDAKFYDTRRRWRWTTILRPILLTTSLIGLVTSALNLTHGGTTLSFVFLLLFSLTLLPTTLLLLNNHFLILPVELPILILLDVTLLASFLAISIFSTIAAHNAVTWIATVMGYISATTLAGLVVRRCVEWHRERPHENKEGKPVEEAMLRDLETGGWVVRGGNLVQTKGGTA